jgi:hypothetical protein
MSDDRGYFSQKAQWSFFENLKSAKTVTDGTENAIIGLWRTGTFV